MSCPTGVKRSAVSSAVAYQVRSASASAPGGSTDTTLLLREDSEQPLKSVMRTLVTWGEVTVKGRGKAGRHLRAV